jgi:hypothetical protein
VIFRGDLRHHKDTRTNFTISNTSGAMGSPKVPEMEFLDITLTKRLGGHPFHSPCYWWMLKKTILFSSLKNPCQKIRETRKLKSIHE